MKKITRRAFLGRTAALSSVGFAARLGALGFAASSRAQAAGASDYKALVCVFMFGGNDGNNTVVPLDSSGYANYSKVRNDVHM